MTSLYGITKWKLFAHIWYKDQAIPVQDGSWNINNLAKDILVCLSWSGGPSGWLFISTCQEIKKIILSKEQQNWLLHCLLCIVFNYVIYSNHLSVPFDQVQFTFSWAFDWSSLAGGIGTCACWDLKIVNIFSKLTYFDENTDSFSKLGIT